MIERSSHATPPPVHPRLRVTGHDATGDMAQWREVLVGATPMVLTEVAVDAHGAVCLDTEIVGMSRGSAVAMLRSVADAIERDEAGALLAVAA